MFPSDGLEPLAVEGHPVERPEWVRDVVLEKGREARGLPTDIVEGEDGLIARVAGGLHKTRGLHFRQRAYESTREARAKIRAAPSAAAGRRDAAERKRAAATIAESEVVPLRSAAEDANDPVRVIRDELTQLRGAARGYVTDPVKDYAPAAVAAALTPLLYLSTTGVSDSVGVRLLVVQAVLAAVYVVEIFLGAVLAEFARLVRPERQLAFLAAVAVGVGLATGAFELLAGLFREAAVRQDGSASTIWTVPLGFAATASGAGIVAAWHLGEPGRMLREELSDAIAARNKVRAELDELSARVLALSAEARTDEAVAFEIEAAAAAADADLNIAAQVGRSKYEIEMSLAEAHRAEAEILARDDVDVAAGTVAAAAGFPRLRLAAVVAGIAALAFGAAGASVVTALIAALAPGLAVLAFFWGEEPPAPFAPVVRGPFRTGQADEDAA